MIAALVVLLAVAGYRSARADPVVRRAAVALPGWPAGAAPVTIALLGDIHIGSPAMDAARLARIADQVDTLRPDLIVIAGDFVFGHDPGNGAAYAARLRAPLARLRAPLGVVAVLGNHDHWTAPVAVVAALTAAGITVLDNRAVERGPVAVIGIDDAFTHHADPDAALAMARGLPGARVVVSHAPDVLPLLPRGTAPLVLTAHTHCGQTVIPGLGALVSRSLLTGQRLFDPRYRCGMIRDPGRTVIVTGGLGTSVAPVRLGAPPDLWLVRVGP